MERAKQTTKALHELTESYTDLHRAIKSTARDTAKTKTLWREGNKSSLIRIGMACMVFPDPSPVSYIIGGGLLMAGAVQKGIQSRTLYIEDIRKNLQSTLREMNSAQV